MQKSFKYHLIKQISPDLASLARTSRWCGEKGTTIQHLLKFRRPAKMRTSPSRRSLSSKCGQISPPASAIPKTCRKTADSFWISSLTWSTSSMMPLLKCRRRSWRSLEVTSARRREMGDRCTSMETGRLWLSDTSQITILSNLPR